MAYPKFFPAIREFRVLEGNIFVQTFNIDKGKTKYLILDLEGNLIHSPYLPLFEEGNLITRFVYTFHGNSYYYFKYNENTENWELHRTSYRQ